MATCEKCEDEFDVDDGCEDDGLCHPCAHAMVDEARALLETFNEDGNPSKDQLLTEIRRLRRALLTRR
jgi:hypothetical protein